MRCRVFLWVLQGHGLITWLTAVWNCRLPWDYGMSIEPDGCGSFDIINYHRPSNVYAIQRWLKHKWLWMYICVQVWPSAQARTGATPEQVYLHLVIIYYLAQDWSYPRTACPNWSYPRTGVFAFSNNNYINYLTQDWSYPRTACPNWSYPRTGVFAFRNNNYVIWRNIGVTPELHARTRATPEQVYLHLVIIYYLTQDWSYPRTACPNWSYPRTGVIICI